MRVLSEVLPGVVLSTRAPWLQTLDGCFYCLWRFGRGTACHHVSLLNGCQVPCGLIYGRFRVDKIHSE